MNDCHVKFMGLPLLVAVLLVQGCAPSVQYGGSEVQKLAQYAKNAPIPQNGSLLMKENYRATLELLYTQARVAEDPETGIPHLDQRVPILITTFVNLDTLDESSPLGRLIPEQIGNRMTQLGYLVTADTLRNKLGYKKDVGALALSRDLEKIAKVQNAQAVVTGTYTVGIDRVYVSTKLTRFGERTTVAGYDYVLPLNESAQIKESNNLDQLLQKPTSKWTVQSK